MITRVILLSVLMVSSGHAQGVSNYECGLYKKINVHWANHVSASNQTLKSK